MLSLHHIAATVMQDDDISGVVRYRTYEVLKAEAANPRLRWAYLPYSMHMAGPREAIQHMIIRKNYGTTRRDLLRAFIRLTAGGSRLCS